MQYIFITPSIVEIGGAEFYISRKIDYLKSKGITVFVFSLRNKEITIDNLKEYWYGIIPELAFPFNSVPKSIKNKIVNKILSLIDENDQVVIESNMTTCCPWGEYIASKVGGLHFCYLLSEGFPVLSKSESLFFRFKLNQNLLFGIKKESVGLLFRDNKDYRNTLLSAIGCTSGIVQNVELPPCINNNDYDYTILSLGRVSKPYILPMCKSISKFASAHPQYRLRLILVGDDATENEKRKIISTFKKTPNVCPILTGALSPLPLSIFEKSDVAIATAGCARVCDRYGVPTISIDVADSCAIGILGITTTSLVYRDKEPKIQVEKLIEDVLVKKLYKHQSVQTNPILDYSSHDAIIKRRSSEQYYSVEKIKVPSRYRIQKFIHLIIGTSFLNRLLYIYLYLKTKK